MSNLMDVLKTQFLKYGAGASDLDCADIAHEVRKECRIILNVAEIKRLNMSFWKNYRPSTTSRRKKEVEA